MKTSTLIVFLLLSFTLFAELKTKKPAKPVFYIESTSSTRTVIINGDSVTVKEWIEQYDNPVSSMPSSRKEVVKKSVIPATKISELQTLILKKNGFFSLPKNEYGASISERFYPYSLLVKIAKAGGKTKEKMVVYRSNPAPETEKAPQSFTEVEKKINEIVEGIKEWK